MILFVGDIHGNVSAINRVYEDAVKRKVKAIIQVGDFGIHWPGVKNGLDDFFNNLESDIPFYFCDGNHENHALLDSFYREQKSDVVEVAKNCFHVRRGTILNVLDKHILFFGGAKSYLGKKDRPLELGKNWWPRELPSWEEFNTFRQKLDKADIVVTHDCPSFLMTEMPYHDLWSKNALPQFLTETISNIQSNPSLWFFGHHHQHEVYVVDNTNYYCCGKHGESWLYTEDKCVKTGIRVVK